MYLWCLLGAQIVGVNCHFDPVTCVKAVKMMKEAVEKAGLKAHYMVQPLAYHTPDCNCQGFIDLPEFPFGKIPCCTSKKYFKKSFSHSFHFRLPLLVHSKHLKSPNQIFLHMLVFSTNIFSFFLSGLEPRILTRWDMHKYAREAYNAGIRYIGGCCGFEPYHIRAVAEELAAERGITPPGSEKHGMWGAGLEMHTKPWVRARLEATPIYYAVHIHRVHSSDHQLVYFIYFLI